MRRPIVITMALLLLCGFCLAAGLGAGSYAGVDSPLLRLSHENMKAASGRISFWSGGNQLSFTVTAPEKGLYKLLLNAWGSLCENEGPIMRASVAGQSVGTWKLNDKPAICASPALKLEAGDHEVTISFLNDKSAGKEDRNLYLNGVACGAVKSETALPALLFGGRPLAAYGKPQEPQDGRKTEVKLSSGGGLQSGEFAGTASGLWRVSSENMRSKAGQLSFWGSSHLTLEVNAPQDGLYKFVIRAWGSPCQGVWPLMSLEVGEKNCLWTASGNPQLFITPAVELAAGRQQVKIAFANDGNAGKEDRNLFLNGFAFGQVSESGALPELLFDNKPLSSLGRPVEGKLKKLAAKNPWEQGVAPFYPAKKELADYSSPVAAQDQLSVKLDCGAGYRLSEFSTVQSLNGKWKISGLSAGKEPFAADEDLAAGYQKPDFNDASWDSIDVPLDWYRKYPAARTEAKPFVKGWYRKALEIPASLRGKRVFLRFDVIGYEALLFVNGRQVGSHHGDFTPWDVEITDFVSFGAANTVALRVFSDFGNRFGSPLPATHTYGSQWSIGNIKGGLWQNVSLRYEEPVHFQRVQISPLLDKGAVAVDYALSSRAQAAETLNLYATVVSAMRGDGKTVAKLNLGKLTVKPGEQSGRVEVPLENPRLWSPEEPYLYYLSLALEDAGTVKTAHTERFGYRDFKVKGRDFYLNGRRLYLFGENLSSIGYGGVGAGEEAEKRALAKKMIDFRRQGYKIIRNPHQPIIPLALEVADEVGMMVYNEWAWAFTNVIAEEEFEKRNLAELAQWVARDYNHPAVVMWSLGNEVKHGGKPDVCRQLDKQVQLVRRLDRSGRPVGSFSGVADLGSYGSEKMDTDFLDLHTYFGLSGAAWPRFGASLTTTLENTAAVYGEGGKHTMPFIIWECVGYSWGFSANPAFSLNDIEQYAKYVNGTSTWAQPNGIGFAGTIGLEAALDPKRGAKYGREIMGKRLIDAIRYQHDEIQGFAPWFHDSDTSAAALWNQPLYVGLRSEGGAFLTNLFSGRSYPQNLFLVNSQSQSLRDLIVKLTLVFQDRIWPLAQVGIASLAAWEKVEQSLTLAIPQGLAKGNYQVRVQVYSGSSELSRNFYDVLVADPAEVTAKLETKRKVAVWDSPTKEAKAFQEGLAQLGIAATPIDDLASLSQYDVLVMPPASALIEFFAQKEHSEELLRWIYQGGRYLQLEQNYVGLSPLGQELYPAENTYVDLAVPDHPVFSGLAQRHFDTWLNPERGNSIKYAFSPFTVNALAVRGPFLGGRGTYNAVAEGTYGEGLIFTSQLLAAALWQEDGAAATYLRAVLDYVLNAEKSSYYTQPWLTSQKGFSVASERIVPVDLRPYVTTGFEDETDGDKKGGWTDQGDNDMRMLTAGKQDFLGVPMEIIDPASNGGKSCIVLAGGSRPYFPAKVEGIAVGRNFSRLFFLHTMAWSSKTKIGEYRIHYEDETTETVDLAGGLNIGDWWFPGDLPQAYIAYVRENLKWPGIGLWLFVWENPKPDVAIAAIDFVSNGSAVPALVAVSGETVSESLVIDDFEAEKKWSCLRDAKAKTDEPVPVARRSGKGDADVKAPQGQYALKLTLPKKTQTGGTPVVFTKFPTERLRAGQKYDYLTFWLKAENAGVVRLALPKDDWSSRLETNLTFPSGEWRKIRLSLKGDLGLGDQTWDLAQLRGEFFIYQQNLASDTVVYLDDIRFE